MNKALKKLEGERAALARRRDLALRQQRGFEDRLAALRDTWRQAEAQLRKAKRAALIGGPGRLDLASENELVHRMTELPVEEAALQTVIAEVGERIEAIDREIRDSEVALTHAQLDEVEHGLLGVRLDELRLTEEREAVFARGQALLDRWHSLEAARRNLGDLEMRPWVPNDHPDRHAYDATSHERTREEHRASVKARMEELQAQMAGKEAAPSTASV